IATVTITVTNVNDAPVVSDIPDQTVAEDTVFTVINLDDYVYDVDDADSEITWTATGNDELIVSIDDRIATVSVPDSEWSGSETITFTATDVAGLSDSDAATFTVEARNDAPTAEDDRYNTYENTALTISAPGVLSNDADIENNPLTAVLDSNPAYGAVSLNSNGGFTYTPDGIHTGIVTFTYHANDGQLENSNSNIATVTINIVGVNDKPTFDLPVSFADVAEDSGEHRYDLSAYANDEETASADLIYTVTAQTGTSLICAIEGTDLVCTTQEDQFGEHTVTVRVTDLDTTTPLSAEDTVSITVTSVNDAPTTADGSVTTFEDTPYIFSESDFTYNDVDGGFGEIMIVRSVPDKGSLQINDGTTTKTINVGDILYNVEWGMLFFTPSADEVGSPYTSFTFVMSDNILGSESDLATMTINVISVNDAPVAIDDAVVTNEDTAVTVDVLANDVDVDGDSLSVTAVTQGTVAGATVTFTASGVTYTPALNFNGVDSFTYTITDGTETSTATVSVTVGSVNDAPIFDPLSNQTIVESDSLTFTIHATDVENNLITYTMSGLPLGAGSLNPSTGVFSWTPSFDDEGIYPVTFTATDDGTPAASGSITINILVINVNRNPNVDDLTYSTGEDTPLSLTLSGTDLDGDTLTISTDTSSTIGTLTHIFANSYTYNPQGQFDSLAVGASAVDSFTYTVTDGHGGTDTAVVTITIIGVNDAPVAVNDAYSTEEDAMLNVPMNSGVLANDNDLDVSDVLSVLGISTAPTNGYVVINSDGSFTYTPNTNFVGTDTFKYDITDSNGGISTGIVVVTVTNINDAPVASDVTDFTDEDTEVIVTLSYTDADTGDFAETASVTNVLGGTITTPVSCVSGVCTVGLTPLANSIADVTADFTINDGEEDSNTATITLTVIAVNDAPIVNGIPDQTIVEGAAFATFDLDTYLSEVDGDAVTWSYSGEAALTVSIDADNVVTITIPSADWTGAETITFRATDLGGLFGSDAATFTVIGVNDAPVAAEDTATTNEDTAVSIDVLANDVDIDGDTLTINGVTQGTNGAVTFTASDVTYTPALNYNGVDSFTYTITDGTETSTATVSVTVGPVNDAPVVNGIPDQTVVEGAAFATFDLDTYLSEVDGDAVTWSYSGEAALTVSIDADNVVTLTIPSADWTGEETITFRATDLGGLFGSDPATFTVTGVNDAPVITDFTPLNPVSINEGDNQLFTVNALDPDGDILTYTWTLDGVPVLSGDVNSFSYTPGFTNSGVHSLIVTISDGTSDVTNTWTINVANINRVPTITASPASPVSLDEGESQLFSVTASDPDGDSLTYSWLFDNRLVSTGTDFNYLTDYSSAGEHHLVVSVSDGVNTVSNSWTIIVGNVNQAPVITSTPITDAFVDELYEYLVTATDEESLIYVIDVPAGMTISEDGLIQWTPKEGGNYPVIVTISDGEFEAVQEFTIFVEKIKFDMKIMTARLDKEEYSPGEMVKLSLTLDNNGNKKIDDARVSLLLPELGVKKSSSLFDLRRGESKKMNVQVPLPYYVDEGAYLLKITVSNDDKYEAAYRYVYVVN
ncbi:tandem-95 repeat protein, partial [Candidatus Woesearchaeota archaeon]|nr:tandem-95 repeat protein [Candidatus Woesearchaeota archaeon]